MTRILKEYRNTHWKRYSNIKSVCSFDVWRKLCRWCYGSDKFSTSVILCDTLIKLNRQCNFPSDQT